MLGFLIFALIVILAAMVVIYCCDLLLGMLRNIPPQVPTIVRIIIILIALVAILQRGLPLVGSPSLL